MMREGMVLRLALALVRVCAVLVPRASRSDWRAEWEGEIRHRWGRLQERQHFDWRMRIDLLRRTLGALPDAAWLRRQFTADADIVHDLRHAARMLRRSPFFTVSAVLILAIGIGGTVSIATLLDTLYLRPLPYQEAGRVVTLWQRPAGSGAREDVAPANFLDWRARARSFETMAAAVPYSYDYTGGYTGGSEPEVFFGAQATEGFFEALGVRPALGRTFLAEEHVRGARNVALITHGLWQRRFGADPGIVDRAISLDDEPFVVVGVLPRDFAPQMFPRPGERGIWTPKIVQEHEHRIRGSSWWNVVARLRPGVTPGEAQAEMDAIARALEAENPGTNRGLGIAVVPLRDHLMGNVRLPLVVMLAAVVLVLAIGCANVASLLLARGMHREREFAIRAALGAGRGRLVRQLVAESLLLSLLAAAAGVALAHWALGAIVALAPGTVLRLQEASIDLRMFGFAALLTGATAVGFGLLPALQFSRPGTGPMSDRHASAPGSVLRRTLIVGEVALALVLLTGAGLLARSFARLLSVDPGFSPRGVVALQVFAHDRNGTPERARAFFSRTLERLQAIPGVEAVGTVSAMPFISANIDIRTPLEIVGRPPEPQENQRGAYLTIASPGYFDTMSIALRAGRLFTDRDNERAPAVALISEALARREWGSESPLGHRIRMLWQGRPVETEIVGVVSQVRHDSLDSAPRAEVFVPLLQLPFASVTYVLRGTGSPAGLIEAAKREVWAVDPLQTFYDTARVEQLVEASVVRQRFSTTVVSAFALVALLLSATGIYGIVSFTTSQRTREIGVRMALGAEPRAIRRMVLREGSSVIGIGLAAGLAGALAGTRVLESLLYEIRPDDPLTFVTVSLLLAAAGLVACWMPARRATRVDPVVALRVE